MPDLDLLTHCVVLASIQPDSVTKLTTIYLDRFQTLGDEVCLAAGANADLAHSPGLFRCDATGVWERGWIERRCHPGSAREPDAATFTTRRERDPTDSMLHEGCAIDRTARRGLFAYGAVAR